MDGGHSVPTASQLACVMSLLGCTKRFAGHVALGRLQIHSFFGEDPVPRIENLSVADSLRRGGKFSS